MIATDRRLPVLRRLALVCAALVLVITSASALLRLSKAGLGCADWPACYGESLRRAQAGAAPAVQEQTAIAAVRLVHRVSASVALLLVIMMLMICFGARPLLVREGVLAFALLALALFLAVLGSWSAAARVPAVAMGNLLGGFAMLALSIRLASARRPLPGKAVPAWVVVAMLACVLQIALGSLASASFAGLSCVGAAGCAPLEVLRAADWATLDPWREPILNAAPPFNPAGALVNILHRGGALVVALLLVPLGVWAVRRGRRLAGATILAALGAQLAVGAALSALALPLVLAVLHNAIAALLLAALLTLL